MWYRMWYYNTNNGVRGSQGKKRQYSVVYMITRFCQAFFSSIVQIFTRFFEFEMGASTCWGRAGMVSETRSRKNH